MTVYAPFPNFNWPVVQGGGAIQVDKNNMVWTCKTFDLTLSVVLFCPVEMCSKWIFLGLDLCSLFLMIFLC